MKPITCLILALYSAAVTWLIGWPQQEQKPKPKTPVRVEPVIEVWTERGAVKKAKL